MMSKNVNGECEPWVVASRLRDHLLLPRERKEPLLWKKVHGVIMEWAALDYSVIIRIIDISILKQPVFSVAEVSPLVFIWILSFLCYNSLFFQIFSYPLLVIINLQWENHISYDLEASTKIETCFLVVSL